MPTIFAFDPSVNNIGWCVRSPEGWEGGTISLPPSFNLHERLNRIKAVVRLRTRYTHYPIQQLVYEEPTFMASTKGKIAAQKGYTINLGIVCGFILGCFDISPHDTFAYTPGQWKGNVPKSATQVKYARTFGLVNPKVESPPSEHEIDATMMLYHHCEKMNYL